MEVPSQNLSILLLVPLVVRQGCISRLEAVLLSSEIEPKTVTLYDLVCEIECTNPKHISGSDYWTRLFIAEV